jgi:leucyl-tRNA synthetase
VERDLQDVLRDLRMGTAQVGSPEQFFALVSPAAGAIRESLEAVPRAVEELQKTANELRANAVDLQRPSEEVLHRIKQAAEAVRALTSSSQQIVSTVAHATESMQRSIERAGSYPQLTLWLVIVLAAFFAFWSRSEVNQMHRRFDALEHNQIVIAQGLGFAVAHRGEAPASPWPHTDETRDKSVRGRAVKGRAHRLD